MKKLKTIIFEFYTPITYIEWFWTFHVVAQAPKAPNLALHPMVKVVTMLDLSNFLKESFGVFV